MKTKESRRRRVGRPRVLSVGQVRFRAAVLIIRLTAIEKRALVNAAHGSGLTMSELVRSKLIRPLFGKSRRLSVRSSE
jgi:hypothetical protein